MAQTMPTTIPTAALDVEAGVGAYDPTLAVELQNSQTSPLTRGQYSSLAVYDAAGAGALVTFGVFRDALLTDLVHEFAVTWPAGASSADAERRTPKSFYSGLWAACWSAVGGETFRVTPDCLHIAGV